MLLFIIVYVDSSDRCNDLSFQLGGTATGVTAIPTRKWSIKVIKRSILGKYVVTVILYLVLV